MDLLFGMNSILLLPRRGYNSGDGDKDKRQRLQARCTNFIARWLFETAHREFLDHLRIPAGTCG